MSRTSPGRLLALDAAEVGRHAIYNLGNGQGYSVRQVIETARGITQRTIHAVDAPRRPGDRAVLVASSALAASEPGWAPEKPALDEMVRDAWTWLRSWMTA